LISEASDAGSKYLYSLVDNFTVMDDSKEYKIYLEALDEERSAWGRRTAIKRLSECKTEESLITLTNLLLTGIFWFQTGLKGLQENIMSPCALSFCKSLIF
jgi:hypothetical protein